VITYAIHINVADTCADSNIPVAKQNTFITWGDDSFMPDTQLIIPDLTAMRSVITNHVPPHLKDVGKR
jgi:hypothetical protein